MQVEYLYIILTVGLFILSVVSGMLGLGVAFAAIPFLGLFLQDLIHQIQPLSLLLNGITALLATLGFGKSGLVDWKKAIVLSVVTTVFAPIGAYIVHFVEQKYVWFVYFFAVVYLAYRLFKPIKRKESEEKFTLALILAIPISILSGFLGVGPGFLLMPTLIIVGIEPKKAAGINAWAVTPPSFSALIPHIKTAHWDLSLVIPLVIAGAIGAFIGARLTSIWLPSNRLKQLFGVVLVIVTLYKVLSMFSH
ncbi:sulfite exporter TauE/SafE family protein [Thermodesulfobacterium hveragerdense]|uniref:sulfite exporter TauE/SafE family protein n=1 Tax=Thermodesulfobacterium hveragerdense TaxID=53424 RepID=UPI0004130FE6|nr:sulfite exporter TauE/SafE family protein [Thermodesulfobacterium hveragerdense]